MTHFISYVRLSKKKKLGEDQPDYYGIEAQRKTIAAEIQARKGVLLHEYCEIESGTRSKLYRRIEIIKAIQHCRDTKATLIVAKLDRLARDSEFIMKVMNSGIEVLFCDFKFEGIAGRMMLQVLAAFAEYEVNRIQQRTKEGLAIVKASGKKLGNPNIRELRHAGAAASAAARRLKIEDSPNVRLKGQMEILRYRDKMSYKEIADKLNSIGHRTTYNKPFTWHTVKRILKSNYAKPRENTATA